MAHKALGNQHVKPYQTTINTVNHQANVITEDRLFGGLLGCSGGCAEQAA